MDPMIESVLGGGAVVVEEELEASGGRCTDVTIMWGVL